METLVAVKLLLNTDLDKGELHDLEGMQRVAQRAMSLSNPILRNLQVCGQGRRLAVSQCSSRVQAAHALRG